jgi:hypothetical protein
MLDHINNDADEFNSNEFVQNDGYSDDDLRARGLTKVTAWVKDKPCKAAGRSKKCRDKAAAERGVKQFNVTAPANEDARASIKAVADALINGRLDPRTLHTVALGAVPDQGVTEGLSPDLAACRQTLEAGGWRGWALRRLVGMA